MKAAPSFMSASEAVDCSLVLVVQHNPLQNWCLVSEMHKPSVFVCACWWTCAEEGVEEVHSCGEKILSLLSDGRGRVSDRGEIAWGKKWGSSHLIPPLRSLFLLFELLWIRSLSLPSTQCISQGLEKNKLFLLSVCVCVFFSVAMHQALDTLSDSTSSTTANDLDLIFLKGIMESPVVRGTLNSEFWVWKRGQITITPLQHKLVCCKIQHFFFYACKYTPWLNCI